MGIFFRDDDDNNDDEYTGQTGDPLHDAIYGWDMGSASSYDDEEEKNFEVEPPSYVIKRDEYSKKAWDYYMDFKEDDALHYIDLALDLDKNHSNNWNIKAIILEAMKRYQESEECYNRSLELNSDNVVIDNKTRMFYKWAQDLIEESKKLPDGLKMLEEAKEKNIKAISTRPGDDSDENIDKYLEQRDTINFYIDYERKYQRNLETVKSFDKSELFTITGRNYYNNIPLTPGISLKLVKEPYNEFDKDAIAVFVEDEKIGYVSNNDYTKYELTSSASELQDKFQNIVKGSYLLYLERYGDIQFAIGRIIK